ncbi:MAG: pyridoxal-phosphate dependent enzyme [Synergistaceae bacterium]|jgi:L-serine/L-threonine ammonia-lyase|nr:pyridoxal-phosphate dependent enzyme [Synergistaceae bacterium]
MALHRKTPLLESVHLSKASGRRVFLKMENMQPAGSFKLRGIGRVCEEAARTGAKRFISPSGGNAGYAAAWAGRELGLPVSVIVPETTSSEAKEALATLGAEVTVSGKSWKESNELALEMAARDGSAKYIHAFDDPLMWDGHGTMIDEAAKQGPKPDAVVLSVGGGGLLCGVAAGMDRNGWGDVPILACETEGAASCAAALEAGEVVELDGITSVATSLGAVSIAEGVLELAGRRPLISFVAPDRAAVSACSRFLDDHRVLVEPACGISLAALYEDSPLPEGAETVLVVVCGGIGISARSLRELEARFGPGYPY